MGWGGGGGGGGGAGGGSMSAFVTSDMSRYFRLNIFFTTLCWSNAMGLKAGRPCVNGIVGGHIGG